MIFSPCGLLTLLTALAVGSGGQTRSELTSVLQLPASPSSYLTAYQKVISELNLDNVARAANIFIDSFHWIDQEYKETIKTYFHTEIQNNINFLNIGESANKINDWMKNATSSKIQKVVEPYFINYDTNMILADALFFKGKWRIGFDPENTKSREFFVSRKEIVDIKMMSLSSVFAYAKLDKYFDCSMLEIPFSGGRLVMQIVLPREKGGLRELEKKIFHKNIFQTFNAKKQWKKINVLLPKFKMDVAMSLSQHLKHLGLTGLFMESHPDFSGIDSSKFLHVDRVEQRLSLEIGEDGDVVQPYKAAWPEAEFTVNHPFLFFIRDKLTGVLLVHGRIAEPFVTSSLLA